MAKAKLKARQVDEDTLQDADNDTRVQVEKSPDEDKIRFDTAGTERMIITNDGKVGIGTTTPASPLHVYGDVSNAYAVLVDNDQSTAGHGMKITSDGTGTGTNLLDLEAASTTLFRFRADGRLGIGTTSPTVKLDVSGSMQASGDLYVDKIRRATDSGTTTKILLNDEVIKIYAGHSSDNICTVDLDGLKVHASLALTVLNINAANDPGATYTIAETNCVILVNTRPTAEGGIDSAIVLTLPDASDNPGMVVTVKDAAGYSDVHRIFVVPAGTDKIDGVVTSFQIPAVGGWVRFISDGANSWAQIG